MNSKTGINEILRRYRDDGFVVIRQFLSAKEIGELRAEVERLVSVVVPQLPCEHVFYEDVANPLTLKQIQHVGEYDRWFGEMFYSGRFRILAEQLMGSAVVPKNMQYFNKPPGTGQPTPPHQDGHYFMLDPCEALTMWLALDDVDEENGCVRYARGSHRLGMRKHRRTETLGFSQGIADYPAPSDSAREVAVSGRAGDLLVHDARTIHLAGGNTSQDRTRRALGFIYYSQRAREDAASHAEYQRQLADDMKAAGKI